MVMEKGWVCVLFPPLNKSFNLSRSKFPHLLSEDNGTYLTLFQELNVKCLVQRGHSVNGSQVTACSQIQINKGLLLWEVGLVSMLQNPLS